MSSKYLRLVALQPNTYILVNRLAASSGLHLLTLRFVLRDLANLHGGRFVMYSSVRVDMTYHSL